MPVPSPSLSSPTMSTMTTPSTNRVLVLRFTGSLPELHKLEQRYHEKHGFGRCQPNPDSAPEARPSQISRQPHARNQKFRWHWRRSRNWRRRSRVLGARRWRRFRYSIWQENLGSADQRLPVKNLQAYVGHKCRHGMRSQRKRRKLLGRNSISDVSQQRIPPAMRQVVAEELADVHRPGFQLQRRQSLRGNHVPQIAEDRAIPRQLEQVAGQNADIHRFRGKFQRRQTLRCDAINEVQKQRAPQRKIQAFRR